MNVFNLLDDYTEIKDCVYKKEHYSVRDNGAVKRHAREGKRIRREDEFWTFGKPNAQTGYMEIGSERVHRIVAYAFLGEPPTPQHVVDHIDTNRRNNRPQNLRWLTKLENVLNNPITRKKIEYLCGSIEVFVNDPSIIQEFANNNPNFEWMRSVTLEEAKASYERLRLWSISASNHNKTNSGALGEWIYSPHSKKYHRDGDITIGESAIQSNNQGINTKEKKDDDLVKSLTPNAMQKYWRTPTEFPLCPLQYGTQPLVSYYNMIKRDMVITKNQYSIHYVDDFALCNDALLVIRTHTDEGMKKYSLISISFENGNFIHEGKTFFEERGAQKAYTLAQGLEWNGEDGIDDFC